MLIRAAGLGDVAAIAAIYRCEVSHGTGTFETIAPDDAEMEGRRARIVAAGYPFLVAEDRTSPGSAILGYAHAAAFRERQAFAPLVEDSVYVDEAARGRRVGTALLEALVREAEGRGFRQMLAVVGDSANSGSIALHARCGFAHVGVMRSIGWKAGRWLDIVLMQRALGAGNSKPAT